MSVFGPEFVCGTQFAEMSKIYAEREGWMASEVCDVERRRVLGSGD